MKFADRLKFTATGTSAATITFGAAVSGFRTLAQAIADGAYVVGDTGVPFTIDDGAGNKETSLFTITSATVLTRTSVRSSSAGGTTPATFTGATLNVFNSMPADFASRLVIAAAVSGVYAVGETLTAAYPVGTIGSIQFVRTLLVAPFTRTPIANAVASAVNSLTYQVTVDDAGYRIDVDCSNQVSTVTGGAVPAAVATVKNTGVMRLFGTQNQQASASAISNTWISAVIKMQIPAGAIGVRVGVHNNSPAYGMEYAKVAVATTDIAACDTAEKAYIPYIAGTAFNVISSTTSDKGFVKGKWGGNSTSRRIYPTNAVLPSLGYNNQEDTVVSDVIPFVPVRATDRTKEEYYALVRVAVNGRNGQDGISQVEGGSGKTGSNLFAAWNNTKDNAAGMDTPLFCLGGANSDMVDGTLAIPGGIGNGWGPVVSVEWTYPTGVTPITILGIGDSLQEGYRWPRLGANRRSNAARPIHHENYGGSTTRTESYLGNLYLRLQNYAKPDYVLMPLISPNNYSPLANFNIMANAQAEYARLVEVAQFLAALGIKMIWWVPVNYSPKVNPTDPNDVSTSWNYLYNNAKKYAAANGIEWLDINGDSRVVWVNGTTYNASTAPTSWNGDGTHPSDPVGIEGFATIYAEKLAAMGL
jgi:hypothetical protein